MHLFFFSLNMLDMASEYNHWLEQLQQSQDTFIGLVQAFDLLTWIVLFRVAKSPLRMTCPDSTGSKVCEHGVVLYIKHSRHNRLPQQSHCTKE